LICLELSGYPPIAGRGVAALQKPMRDLTGRQTYYSADLQGHKASDRLDGLHAASGSIGSKPYGTGADQ
jgi:hypothetical protein